MANVDIDALTNDQKNILIEFLLYNTYANDSFSLSTKWLESTDLVRKTNKMSRKDLKFVYDVVKQNQDGG